MITRYLTEIKGKPTLVRIMEQVSKHYFKVAAYRGLDCDTENLFKKHWKSLHRVNS